MPVKPLRTHFVIPDTQAKAGVPTDHLSWVGEYAAEKKPDRIIHLGDHADMPSLSSYDKGTKSMEGRRHTTDIEAANSAFDILNAPITKEVKRTSKLKNPWKPGRDLLLGNHEDRINRAVEFNPQLEGTLGIDNLNYTQHGWKVHKFLKPVEFDGVWYSHYWYNPLTGNSYGGTVENRLKTIGHSFTQGHTQTLMHGIRFVAGKAQHGLIAGACYLHSESYKGFQGNAHWRGVIVKHEVSGGSYDPMFVSLGYLCRKYEGVDLDKFLAKKYKLSLDGLPL